MKLTTGILIFGMGLGSAWGQNPSIIDNTRAKLNTVEQQQTAASNAALAATQGQSTPAAPASAPKAAPQTAQKPSTTTPPAKPAAAVKAQTTSPAPVPAPAPTSAKNATSQQKQVTVVPVTGAKPAGKTPAAKAAVKADPAKKPAAPAAIAAKPVEAAPVVAVEDKKNPVESKKEDEKEKTINVAGRRDPFISPVVNRTMAGSGCSTGKRCLAIDQIALTGIVKADSGMIAVVVNALNKAYFLRENDPVFNGYVVKITGDSIIFSETIQDKLGKPFTREVTKKISTPAV